MNRTAETASGPDVMFKVIAAGRNLETQLEQSLETVGLSLAWYGVLSHLAQAKEPLAFAFFGLRCLHHQINHLPHGTGAKETRVLGSITRA